jgi:putative FmdB family regulatory protein
MPIYEYKCPSCGRFEVMQKVSDEPLKECPSCVKAGKHQAVSRLISLSAFHLKGSGWYKTDYASNGSGVGGHAKSHAADHKESGAADAPAAAAEGAKESAKEGGKESTEAKSAAQTKEAAAHKAQDKAGD